MHIKVERIDKPLFNWLIAGCTRGLEKASHLTWHVLLMLPMEAKPTRECERPLRPKRSLLSFTRYSSLLAFVCSAISSVVPLLISDDFIRIASNVTRNISRWSHCFSVILLVCLVVYVLGVTMNISQSFQNGEKKRKSPPFRNVWKEWSAHHKNWEESFFHQRGSFLPFESANYSQ